ncbi:MAG: hypothetical protein J0H30_03145, partial [Alphaproteobacteria bacterium]|nr:hypothetical protein [Alphaproteobacteria bacterium]
RSSWPADHVIHMSNPLRADEVVSLARCDCGWENAVPWGAHHTAQDAACEAHWRNIERCKSLT